MSDIFNKALRETLEFAMSTKRPTIAKTFMDIARVLAKRATCGRRQVGCVLVNERNHVIATGYNGVARGQDHCIDQPCPGVELASGQGHDVCEAIHAEQNALLQCKNVYDIDTCYTTTAPCMACTKLLMNTGCKKVIFAEGYDAHSEARELWERAGRSWIHLSN